MELGLEGKVAIVGGASKGIGRAVAMGLAQEGCALAICARREAELEATAQEIRQATAAQVLAMVCDMARYADIKRLVEETAHRFGRIDIIVNNAGGPPTGTFEELTEEQWQHALEQNFLSAVRTTREALAYLRSAGSGRIINITSIAVKQPMDRLILSNAARLAVVGWAKTLSRELAPHGITVNNVCPGNIATERLMSIIEERAGREGRPFPEVVAEEERWVPLGFLGEAEDVANLVVFLASEKARYLTGTTVQVDGGSTLALF